MFRSSVFFYYYLEKKCYLGSRSRCCCISVSKNCDTWEKNCFRHIVNLVQDLNFKKFLKCLILFNSLAILNIGGK